MTAIKDGFPLTLIPKEVLILIVAPTLGELPIPIPQKVPIPIPTPKKVPIPIPISISGEAPNPVPISTPKKVPIPIPISISEEAPNILIKLRKLNKFFIRIIPSRSK